MKSKRSAKERKYSVHTVLYNRIKNKYNVYVYVYNN
jgi:hypothetical protein